MLRCPPSRLSLTAADINDFERRLAARHQLSLANLRLDAGPQRAIRHAIVPEQSNPAQRRAVSCTSSATMHSTEDDADDPNDCQGDAVMLDRSRPPQDPSLANPLATPNRSARISPSAESNSPQRRARLTPLLSSARARRRHDFQIAQQDSVSQFLTEGLNSHLYHYPNGTDWTPDRPEIPQVPVIVLPQDPRRLLRIDSSLPRDLGGVGSRTLDPGAHVFIPHVRMASTSLRSYNTFDVPDMRRGDMDIPYRPDHLRVLPESQQNLRHLNRHPVPRQIPASFQDLRIIGRGRAEQTNGPNLERYPLLRPRVISRQRRVGTLHSTDVAARQATRRSSAYFPLHAPDRNLHVRRVISTPFSNAVEDATTVRALSSGLLTNSLSSPNLAPLSGTALLVQPRSSSLNWNAPTNTRRPSFHSNDSQTSSNSESKWAPLDLSHSRPSDVTEEILGMRQSPLDELAERLSRLASRPRYGSNERNCQESRGCSLSSTLSSQANEEDVAMPESDQSGPWLILLSPKEESNHSGILSSSLPRTANSHISSLLASSSPLRHEGQSPVPNPMLTPRVKVYDDAQPPHTQPQTPAEIHRRERADTFAGRVRQVITRRIALTPSLPQGQPLSSPISPNRQDPFPESSRQERTRRRQRVHHEDTENDLEGHLSGLEHDRSVWVGRREGGTLDVTPPREGRFEQYFS